MTSEITVAVLFVFAWLLQVSMTSWFVEPPAHAFAMDSLLRVKIITT